jgi:hypothetical protein
MEEELGVDFVPSPHAELALLSGLLLMGNGRSYMACRVFVGTPFMEAR